MLSVGVVHSVSDINISRSDWLKQEIEKALLKYFVLRVSSLVPSPRAPPARNSLVNKVESNETNEIHRIAGKFDGELSLVVWEIKICQYYFRLQCGNA